MSGYAYDGPSSSSAPPPPYSVTASASGSGHFGSTSSSQFPPPPTTAAAGAGPSSGYPSGYPSSSSAVDGLGIVDSKWRLADPRSSSAHSLAPSAKDRDGVTRRTLLVIYIHGFYGNESSFRSFPAHVHNHLKDALAETHVVHSKIYPRYKTYKAIDVARDNFSQWLEPHESDSTDVILVGHSMGGLLAAEVAMMPNRHPYSRYPYKHRILGTISLDSPFLGLHPGIIVAGISSLFRPASPTEEKPEHEALNQLSPTNSALTSPNPSMYTLETTSSLGADLSPHPSNTPSMSSSNAPQRPDPTFNPSFFNDVNLKDRTFMRRLGHFAKKHSREGIWDATKNHVMSHLEYGGCLADYPGLNARYNKLRAMESVDPLQHMGDGNNYGNNINRPTPVRVRFINYYTLSSGRPKKPKTPDSPKSPESPTSPEHRTAPSTLQVGSHLSPPSSSTPRISLSSDDGQEMELLEPIPMEDIDERLSTLHEEQQARFDHDTKTGLHSTDTLDKEVREPKGKGKEGDVNSHETPSTDAEADVEAGPAASASATAVAEGESPEPGTAPPMGDIIPEAELPPIPDLPEQPTPPDLDRYTDKDARKQAEKEGKRAQKAYESAVKSRDKAIKERQKLVEKRRKKVEKEAAKEAQRIEKEGLKQQKEEQKRRQQEEEAARKEAAEETHDQKEARRLAEEAKRMEREGRRLRGEPIDSDAEGDDDDEKKKKSEEVEAQMAAMVIAGAAAAAPETIATAAGAGKDRPPAVAAPSSSAASVNTTQTGGATNDTTTSRPKAVAAHSSSNSKSNAKSTAKPDKPKKERKFCTLPGKKNGKRDETWVSVYMEGMDEVGAHCGLFLPGPHYDTLIGDVGERIVAWVQDDMSVRAIMEMP
ncbi:hypothetical protein BDP55DRAFT_634816 [Colletotrichum godetiae]|uniref:DUF676 domain-containing protein n=1 Tax=Colletotrichum godetiae TaxID=1209918 RepID=A0AAJ0EUU1_9PEZI|nr:uncharacterized protein BDP55DRAFT_634816 [Colletotrichum godetiae]KAK1672549.1 hypothetical protein BDP55DRAFT_634816 [Colletotrichum godetiae]